jgi:hypothetical protein
MMHNWLLEYDGRDSWEQWLNDIEDDADNNDPEMEILRASTARLANRQRRRGAETFTRGEMRRARPDAYYETPRHDNDTADDLEGAAPTQSEVLAFTRRRQDLIDHYVAASSKREILMGI